MESTAEFQKKPAQAPMETERLRNRKVYVPKTDIIETAEGMILYADMPGVDEKSVEVTLEKNILAITGAVEPQDFSGRSICYAEYDTGDYERSFTISDEVDREQIDILLPYATTQIFRK